MGQFHLLLAVLILLPALGSPVRADRSERERESRAAFEELLASRNYRYWWVRGSMTERMNRLIACGERAVRKRFKEAWTAARVRHSEAYRAIPELERIARFLWDAVEDDERYRGNYRVVDGAVVQYRADSSSGSGRRPEPELPALGRLLEGRRLRAPLEPDGPALLARVKKGLPKDWTSREREDLYASLGYAAASDPDTLAGLLALWLTKPDHRRLTRAVGIARMPATAAALRNRFEALVDEVAAIEGELDYHDDRVTALREVAAALVVCDPAAVSDRLRGQAGRRRFAVLMAFGLERSVPVLLDEVEAAKTHADRFGASDTLLELVRIQKGGERPRASDWARLIRMLLDLLEEADEDERTRLLVTAEAFGLDFYPWQDFEADLARLHADLSAGRLAFVDRRPGLLDPPMRSLEGPNDRANSATGTVIKGFTSPDPSFPVFASMKWVEEGIRLTLTNQGDRPFLINPVLLRYADAWRRKLGGLSQLTIHLCSFGEMALTPWEELKILLPGESFSWVQAVREVDRSVDHVAIEMSGYWYVPGGTELPCLRWLNTSWLQ